MKILCWLQNLETLQNLGSAFHRELSLRSIQLSLCHESRGRQDHTKSTYQGFSHPHYLLLLCSTERSLPPCGAASQPPGGKQTQRFQRLRKPSDLTAADPCVSDRDFDKDFIFYHFQLQTVSFPPLTRHTSPARPRCQTGFCATARLLAKTSVKSTASFAFGPSYPP
jgi:hypothetical protein